MIDGNGKRSVGRPLRDRPFMKVTVNLRTSTVAFLQEVGDNKLGAGIERLADALRDMMKKQMAEEKRLAEKKE